MDSLCDFLSNTKLPEEKIKERMDYFKDQAKQLVEMRKSGHYPETMKAKILSNHPLAPYLPLTRGKEELFFDK
jgi:hypothetical protein